MGTRRKAKPLEGATAGFQKMFSAVCYRTVTHPTQAEVLSAFWSDELLKLLRDAKEATSNPNYASTQRIRFQTGVDLNNNGVFTEEITLMFNYNALGILCPKPGLMRSGIVLPALEEMWYLWSRFKKVQETIDWCNSFMTLANCRYYFPAVMGILPRDHPIYKVAGSHKLTVTPFISKDVVEKMRDSAGLIAEGLLADPDHTEVPPNASVTVNFQGGPQVPLCFP